MPSNVMSGPTASTATTSRARQLIDRLRATDWPDRAATVVGYGNMGRQHLQALQALGLQRLRVCSLGGEPLAPLRDAGVSTYEGGFERFDVSPTEEEVAIVAVPTALLAAAARRLADLGFRRLLIEKPVALWSTELQALAVELAARGVDAVCAFNRVAYPASLELTGLAEQEGGITSCVYTMTEMVKADWPQRFPPEELARWGIANSLHVVSLAHGLIGWPARLAGGRRGSMPWHPSGSVFVGNGESDRGIPFAYHADWTSKSRWSVEVHTREASYRLCPLEQLTRKTRATGEWEPVTVEAFAPDVKAGLVEQAAAMLSPELRDLVPLVSLERAASLTRFGEDLFGYPSERAV